MDNKQDFDFKMYNQDFSAKAMFEESKRNMGKRFQNVLQQIRERAKHGEIHLDLELHDPADALIIYLKSLGYQITDRVTDRCGIKIRIFWKPDK